MFFLYKQAYLLMSYNIIFYLYVLNNRWKDISHKDVFVHSNEVALLRITALH